jgi:methyl-accepting chemotaxis protein
MLRFFTTSLMGRLLLLFALISILPVLGVGFVAYQQANTALEHEAYQKLNEAREGRRLRMLQYFDQRATTVRTIAQLEIVGETLDMLAEYEAGRAEGDDAGFHTDTAAYRVLQAHADEMFAPFADTGQFHDITLIGLEHGQVMYSTARQRDLGSSLVDGPYRDSTMASAWRRAKAATGLTVTDLALYEPAGEATMILATSVLDGAGAARAVLAVHIGADELHQLMGSTVELGQTGEVYLVGQDRKLRSELRHGDGHDDGVLDDEAIELAFSHEEGVTPSVDHKGVPVLAAYSHLGLDDLLGTDFEWSIIAEIAQEEAQAEARTLAIQLGILDLLVICLVSVAAVLVARGIARPIQLVTDQAVAISQGDLTKEFAVSERSDEVGQLSRAFGSMVMGLRQQTQDIMDGINVIAASGAQISATSSQLAAAAAETATAISETTVTIEEVKQTTQVSTEKARAVSDTASHTVSSSQAGAQAVDKTVARMDDIRQQMETVAGSVVRLSEQSQAIGEIITAVDDLAEQSNLLAVNAAIEAAKAGEHGRGFAVVAQEVKSLAEQSKQATAHVRTILNDIQKATSVAVMATEQGGKAVEAGVEQSSEAGEAIAVLSDGIREANQAAAQIAASAQQQFVGVQQVTEAMEGIKVAAEQNEEGASQLEGAVRDLESVGKRLQELTSFYQL